MARIIVEAANIRSGPGTQYNVVGGGRKGDEFKFISKDATTVAWWKIDYNGQLAWIHTGIVAAESTEGVRVASIIPAVPKVQVRTAEVAPTKTPVPELPNDGRCSFAGTEPRVPDPVGLAVYDCEAWSLAYALVMLDKPEVMFASYDNEVRIDITHLVFMALRQTSLNCSTDIYQIAGIATVAGDMIEAHGNPKDSSLLSGPRIATIGGLKSIKGTVDECRAVAVSWIQSQLN